MWCQALQPLHAIAGWPHLHAFPHILQGYFAFLPLGMDRSRAQGDRYDKNVCMTNCSNMDSKYRYICAALKRVANNLLNGMSHAYIKA